MRTIELPQVPNVIFSQKYYRKYGSNFTSSQRYKNATKINADGTRVNKYDSHIAESAFFFGNDAGSILSYMKRKEAVDKTSIEDLKTIHECGEEKAKKLFKYMKERPGSTGLFDESGSIDEEKVLKLNNMMQNVPNFGWSCVLSFLPEYSDENVNSPYQAQQMLKKVVPEQLKAQGLDPKDFYWFAAYHTNTDNRHIHYVVVPKSQEIEVKGKKLFPSKEYLELMPKLVEREFPCKEHFPLDRDFFMEEFSEDFKKTDNKLAYDAFNVLNRKKQYARLTKDERRIVNSITWKVLNTNSKLKKGLETLREWALKQQEANLLHKKVSGIKATEDDLHFADTMYYAFMNRVYNKTLKLMNSTLFKGVDSFRDEENVLKKFNDSKQYKKKDKSGKTIYASFKTSSQDKMAIARSSASLRDLNKLKKKKRMTMSEFIESLIDAGGSTANLAVALSLAALWRELTQEEKERLIEMQKEAAGFYDTGDISDIMHPELELKLPH